MSMGVEMDSPFASLCEQWKVRIATMGIVRSRTACWHQVGTLHSAEHLRFRASRRRRKRAIGYESSKRDTVRAVRQVPRICQSQGGSESGDLNSESSPPEGTGR